MSWWKGVEGQNQIGLPSEYGPSEWGRARDGTDRERARIGSWTRRRDLREIAVVESAGDDVEILTGHSSATLE